MPTARLPTCVFHNEELWTYLGVEPEAVPLQEKGCGADGGFCKVRSQLNKFQHVWGGPCICKVQYIMGNGHMDPPEQNGWQTNTTENITFMQLRWRR